MACEFVWIHDIVGEGVRKLLAEVGESRIRRGLLFNWSYCRGRGYRHAQTILKDHSNSDEYNNISCSAVINVDNETLPARSSSVG